MTGSATSPGTAGAAPGDAAPPSAAPGTTTYTSTGTTTGTTATEGTSVSPTARGVWRASRGIVLVGVLILAVAAVVVLLSGGGEAGRRLDPADTTLSGGRALAQLLRGAGVRVERVTSVSAAATAAGDGNALLLLSSTARLDEHEARRLAGLPADRLLVEAQPYLDVLAPGVTVEEPAHTRSREPGCALTAATRAGSAYTGGLTFKAPSGAVGCYPAGDLPSLVSYTREGRTITVVGSGDFMTNLRLAEDGNAALAMNLAGARPTLVWLTAPDEPDAAVEPGARTLGDLIPPGVPWAVLQLVIAVLLVALWRGRRLGPVVAERLPVVVRAAETVEGRGRLYHARRARDRAAGALRTGTVDRLTPRLGLPVGAAGDAVVTALAARTGQDAGQVRAALYGAPPEDDAGLVALAAQIETLERQVKET